MDTDDAIGHDQASYPSLTEGAYAVIRHEILTLRLAPGSKLALGDLKARHQTGIAPIREALSRLAGEGLVVSESQRGFWVARVDADELGQLGQLRATLEVMALRFAMTRDRRKLHARLAEAWQSFSAIGQRAGEMAPLNRNWESRHRAFHMALFSAYDTPTTLRLYENVYDRFDRYRRLGVARKGFLAGVIDDHSRLLDLIESDDVDGACVLVRQHILDVVDIVAANVDWQSRAPT